MHIGECFTLQYLQLANNQFDRFPDALKECRYLTALDLRKNNLTTIPEWIVQLQRMKTFNVTQNAILSLPSTLGNLPVLEDFHVDRQRLVGYPKEVIDGGRDALLKYLRQLNEGFEPIYRVKLLVVGQENVGKTSLIRALARNGKWSRYALSSSYMFHFIIYFF